MDEHITALLRKVGLTEYEAHAYLLLLEKGALTAKQISYGAQVPYSKVYMILNSLEKKGWIEAAKKRPNKYFPKSPETALMMARKTLEDEWMQIEAALKETLSPLYGKLKAQEKYDIWILRGLTNISLKLKEMVKKCRKEMLIALPSLNEEMLNEVSPLLGFISKSNLKMRFLITRQLSKPIQDALERIGEVKVKDKMFGGGVISDSGEVMLIVSDERGEISAIWSDHPGLAWLAKDYFEYLWKE